MTSKYVFLFFLDVKNTVYIFVDILFEGHRVVSVPQVTSRPRSCWIIWTPSCISLSPSTETKCLDIFWDLGPEERDAVENHGTSPFLIGNIPLFIGHPAAVYIYILKLQTWSDWNMLNFIISNRNIIELNDTQWVIFSYYQMFQTGLPWSAYFLWERHLWFNAPGTDNLGPLGKPWCSSSCQPMRGNPWRQNRLGISSVVSTCFSSWEKWTLKITTRFPDVFLKKPSGAKMINMKIRHLIEHGDRFPQYFWSPTITWPDRNTELQTFSDCSQTRIDLSLQILTCAVGVQKILKRFCCLRSAWSLLAGALIGGRAGMIGSPGSAMSVQHGNKNRIEVPFWSILHQGKRAEGGTFLTN